MSLKRANYLCGHQSCDNKKCSVRLSRELTRAACHVLERAFRDTRKKERLLSHVVAAGEEVPDLPDLPDLAALDLPLIEDSDTKINLVEEKLNGCEENKGVINKINEARKRLKVKRESKSSRQNEIQCSESSIKSGLSNQTSLHGKSEGSKEYRSKSIPRSSYGPGSNYLKYGGIDVHCNQVSSHVKTTKQDTNRSVVEMRLAGSSKLTNVFGERCGLNDPKGSIARTDFLKYQNKTKNSNPDEPAITGSHGKSSYERPDSKQQTHWKPRAPISSKNNSPEIPDSMDDMKILFQYNSSRLTQPKLKVLDMLADPINGKCGTSKGTVTALNKFPSVWDASDSEDSDVTVLEEQRRSEPTEASAVTTNASVSLSTKREDLVMIPENVLETSDNDDTCVARDLKKEIASKTLGRMPGSFSAKMPLSTVQEARTLVGRNASEISTRQKSKIPTLTYPQVITKPSDILKSQPRTAGISGTRMTSSRTSSTASTASKSAAVSNTNVDRSRTTSTTSKTATGSKTRVLRSRTVSTASAQSSDASDSEAASVKCLLLSATPNTTTGSITGSAKTRIPIATSKLATDSSKKVAISVPITTAKPAADYTTKAVKSRIPTATSKASAVSNTKLLKERKSSTASTASKTAAVSGARAAKNRPASATSNFSSEHTTINSRTASTASAASRTAAVSNTKLIKSRQASTASTASRTADVSNTKLLKGRQASTASTASRTAAVSNTKLLKGRQASTVSTKLKTTTVSGTRAAKIRPASATSNASTQRTASTASTASKPEADALTRANAAAKPSRIPVPVGAKVTGSRPMSHVVAKVDCRRPMTAVVGKLPPNVKLMEERSRPQTSGNEGGRSTSTAKPRLARPSSEMKRAPITVRLGSKTQCVEGEHVKVVYKSGKLSTSNKSSDENVASPSLQGKSSVPRSHLTSTACRSSSGSKEGSHELISREIFEQMALVSSSPSKIPRPVNPDDRGRITTRDETVNSRAADACDSNLSQGFVRKNKPSIFEICEEMLEDEKLSASMRSAMLKMNREAIKTGKLRPMRPATAFRGSKEKLVKANTELEAKIDEILPPAQHSKVNVRNRISLFDTLQDSVTASEARNSAKKDESLEDDYANLLELDNTEANIGLQNRNNSITESMMSFIRKDALKVAKELVVHGDDEHSTDTPEGVCASSNDNKGSLDG